MTEIENIVKKGYTIDGRFEITFPIAHHGPVRSFRAKDSSKKTFRVDLVELAALPSHFFDDSGKLLQVERMSTLDHYNVARLTEEGEVVIGRSKFAYLVFEFVGGETLLDKFTREGAFTQFKAIPIICSLLDAVGYLHNQDPVLVHNGVDLDCVSIDYSENRERPVLTRFYQIRTIFDSRRSISTKNLSIFHAAPELLRGIFVPQSDIFSVGAVLYHLLFGVPPWYDEKIAKAPLDKAVLLLAEARERGPNFIAAEDAFVDDYLISTLRKALTVDATGRFESAEEFQKALKREYAFVGPEEGTGFGRPTRKHEKKPGTGFDAIAGMDELKATLHNEVIRPIVERERFESFGIPLLNGVLLFGPPGCGKTYIAERLVEEIGFDFMVVNPSDLASPFVHGGQEKIGQLFKEASERSPCLVFIDEFDAIVPSREDDISHHYAAEVNAILALLNNCGERGIFVIAATNMPEKIDAAVLRSGRFDKIIYLPQPDTAAREQMFKLHLDRRRVELSVDYGHLADLTENYVSSDISKIVIEASRKAEKADSRISMKFLEAAIAENKPSVSRKDLKRYEKLNKQWIAERSGADPDHRKSIGFILDRDV